MPDKIAVAKFQAAEARALLRRYPLPCDRRDQARVDHLRRVLRDAEAVIRDTVLVA